MHRSLKGKYFKIIHDAIHSVDWRKVADMYKKTGWTWHDSSDSPTKYELRDKAYEMCVTAIAEKHYMISSGGISVVWNKKRKLLMIFVGYTNA